ncbi:cellulase family glycosylhydrolase [candidate division KSB1 bacterium]|nr:cellulase family glycosylhydrolase [candidate division KSB1 bacterium]
MRRFFAFLLLVSSLAFAQTPFHRGVNLTSWFQADNVRQIQFTKFTKQDFINIKSLGCDVIRLPVNLHYMTRGAPDYTIDPLFLNFFDQVVDWTEELNLHLILDNHTFSSSVDTAPNVGDILVPVWSQVAEHYKNRSNLLYFEVLNEPHGIMDAVWNPIQQRVIDAIRAVDTKHTIIVGPAGWNSYNNLQYMPEYSDDNLIYTFHFYDPFLFTHQGAGWTSPSLEPLAGVPFPYDAAQMPACPAVLKGTWVEGALNYSYKTEGTVARVKQLIDIAVKFKNQRNVPMFCGEFGVYIPNSDPDDRVSWYGLVPAYLQENGIAWTMWDYTGGFGLFEPGGNDLFDYDLNVPLLEAMGLTVPPQKEFILKPDSTAFDIYLDFIAVNVSDASWAGDGIISFFNETDPVFGEYCIHWTEVGQYNAVAFRFKPLKDLAVLVDKGYALDFWCKSDAPDTKIDVRFIDTKTDDPGDHPWRTRITVGPEIGFWDGNWHHVQVPLKDFTEHGSWDDNAWYNPQGDFDWKATDRLEFVSEHHDLKGINVWIDQVRVVDPAVVKTGDQQANPEKIKLLQNYPNPFNPKTTIRYRPVYDGFVDLAVYNVRGRKIRSLVHSRQQAGEHSIEWDGVDDDGRQVGSGIYFYKIQTDGFEKTRKMIYVR